MNINNYFIIIIIILLIIYYYSINQKKENLNTNSKAIIKHLYNEKKLNRAECPQDMKKICRINGKYKIHTKNPKNPNEANCDAYGIVPKFCNLDGIDSQTGEINSNSLETCTLTPEKSNENIIPTLSKKIPVRVCDSYKCKNNGRLFKQTDGGVCIDDDTGKKCSLDPLRTGGYDLCYKKELYKKYENVIFEYNDKNNIKTIPNSSVEECANKCNKKSIYYGTVDDYDRTKFNIKNGLDKGASTNSNKTINIETPVSDKPGNNKLYFKYNSEYYIYSIRSKYKNSIRFWSEKTDDFNENKLSNFKIVRVKENNDPSNSEPDTYLYIGVSSNFDIALKDKINDNINYDENVWKKIVLNSSASINVPDILIKINNEISNICEKVETDANGYNICKIGIKTCPAGLQKYCVKSLSTNPKDDKIYEHNSKHGNIVINCDSDKYPPTNDNKIVFCDVKNDKINDISYLGYGDNEPSIQFTKPVNNSEKKTSCYLKYPYEPDPTNIPVRIDQEINDYTNLKIGKEQRYEMPSCEKYKEQNESICYISCNPDSNGNCKPNGSLKKCDFINDCQYFTFNKKNKKCKMKNSMDPRSDLRDKSTFVKMDTDTDTYMKLPLNYTEIKQSDLIGIPLKTYGEGDTSTDYKTIEECARICNIYPKCNTFTYGTGINNAGKCELREVKDIEKDENSQNYIENPNTSIFQKKYKYKLFDKDTNTIKEFTKYDDLGNANKLTEYIENNKNQSPNNIGNLCTLNDELANDEIKIEIDKSNKIYKSNLKNLFKKIENKKQNIKNTVKENVMKNTVKFMLDKKSVITWDNINVTCNEIYFELLANRSLFLPYIQIFIEHNNNIIDLFGEIKMDSGEFKNGNRYSRLRTDNTMRTLFSFDQIAYSKYDKNKNDIDLPEKVYNNLLKNNGYYLDDNQPIKNKINNAYEVNDLNICYITKHTKNPTVKFTFYDGLISRIDQISQFKVTKIIVYNKKFGNKDEILPLKIGLRNSYQPHSDIKYIIKDSWDNDMIESKTLPSIPEGLNLNNSYKNLKVIKTVNERKKVVNLQNLGDISKIREWVDLNNTGKKDVYCSFISDNKLRCIDSTKDVTKTNANIIYQINNYNPSDYPNTHYFDKMNDDLHFCRCAKDSAFENSLYTNVYCYNMDPNVKSKNRGTETIQLNKPSNCQNYSGKELKEINLNSSPMDKTKCVNYIDVNTDNQYLSVEKNSIDAGFYKNNKIYIFKNSKLNNSNIVIYKIIDKNKKNENYKIFNNINFPNLDEIFYKKIDACYCNENNIIYFFSFYLVCMFDLNKNNVLPFSNGAKSKTIKEYFFNENSLINNIFTKDITAVVPKFDNILLIFKGTKYIEYNLNKNNNLKIMNLQLDIKDNINLSNISAIININNTLYIINKNLHCKYNIMNNQQDISYGWIKNNKSLFNKNKNKNIWSYNINL